MNRQQVNIVELLAPARDRECGEAAINHGADAVYIGGSRFSAREAAGNRFTDIERLCKYAHRYFAKVYLALNTVLYEHELEQARAAVERAFNIGCDAVIVQDMALVEMDLPPIPLFASTQTDNSLPEKVKFLQDAGFSRVILARELSIAQIAEIRKSTTVELESFVHGSLCVSYSGRCYLSQILAGRSANRGCCAQPCRLPFDLYDERGARTVTNSHLLSLKDLNMSAHLEDLLAAGVTSFKIEGRLKDTAYVKNVTAYYRKRIDTILVKSNSRRKASSGNVEWTFEPEVERSFSRGFTTYFAGGRKRGLNAGTAKSTGKFCGTVVTVDQRSFVVDSVEPLSNGDGICFFDSSGQLRGTGVNRVDGSTIIPLSMENIAPGTAIFRNSDRRFDKKLATTSAVRKIQAHVTIEVTRTAVHIAVTDEDGIRVEMTVAHSADEAVDKDAMRKTLVLQFGKTGNEIFDFQADCRSCEYFFTRSTVNAWRRQSVSLLTQEREARYTTPKRKIIRRDVAFITDRIDFTANVSNSLAEQFYRKRGVRTVERGVETGTVPDRLMVCKYCIKFELGMCPVKQRAGASGDMFLVYAGRELRLKFDCTECKMYVEQTGGKADTVARRVNPERDGRRSSRK